MEVFLELTAVNIFTGILLCALTSGVLFMIAVELLNGHENHQLKYLPI
jgi:hypothetical protein